ncbi:hypothetical protein [Caulobacter sp. 602-1]|uniref:hypothetical protein n=1 Tax=Caulobacter sp. 602-1 TaxID=2492472 RepID=UPI000F643849|nr:hypothetical protein [Caulobacter sp. 602-1]RRN64152.1 hypothetical protein EIK80_15490 [Caulobacter sp. 602-1]
MSDAARLTRLAFSRKPAGTPYANFNPTQATADSIEARRIEAAIDAAYAGAVSYAEALTGLRGGSTSWAVIKLYYSSFYSIRALLLLNGIIPFNYEGEMLYDVPTNRFLKGGRSSHHWNWTSIRKTDAKNKWFSSQDSQDTYDIIREHREHVNYKHSFKDPELHQSMNKIDGDIAKRFRTYRDDTDFIYTYLPEHLTLAYPTRILLEVESEVKIVGAQLSTDRIAHLSSIWKIKDRCLLT